MRLLLGLLLAGTALAGPPLAYLSDVEGRGERLEDFLEAHPLFERGPDGAHHLRQGAHFVHGGDVPDRGDGTLAILETLLRLKAEAPDRVHLIAGNRDLNKLRIPREIGPDDGGRPERLRRILAETMNAAEAYEFRRTELGRRQGKPPAAIDDRQVVESVLAGLRPGGLHRRLLEASELVHRQGGTLFVHGSVTGENLGVVPGEGAPVEDVDEWVERLNAWFHRDLAAGGAGLIDYSRPEPGTRENPRSVVYSRGLGADGLPVLPAPPVIARLRAVGIHRLVVGHTPVGDTPLVLRTPDGSFEVVRADQSYSSLGPMLLTMGGARDRDLHVRSRVTVEGEGPRALAFGLRIGEPSPIGKRLPGGRIVVGRSAAAHVTYRLVPPFRVVHELYAHPPR